MGQSGTKLVLLLVGLAFTAGITSWWYRYTSAHQATEFWGPEAARLIAQPAEVEACRLTQLDRIDELAEGTENIVLGSEYQLDKPQELTNARGMVHFRHVLMSDKSYEWGARIDPNQVQWQWCLRFHEDGAEARVVVSADLRAIGYVVPGEEGVVKVLSCRPLTASLEKYFVDLGLSDASTEP